MKMDWLPRIKKYLSPWLSFEKMSRKNVKKLSIGILALASALTILGAFQILGIKTEYNLRKFFPTYHPLLRQDEQVRERFHINEFSPFILLVQPKQIEKDWSEKGYLDSIRTLTEKIRAIDKVLDVKDISTLQGAVQSNGGLGVGSLIDYVSPESFKREIYRNPILSPLFVSRDARLLTVIVTTQELSVGEMDQMKDTLLQMATDHLAFADVSIGGLPAIQSDINNILTREVIQFIAVSFFMSVFALMMIFRQMYAILTCTLLSLVTNILSIWGVAIFGFSFNILSSTIPILITMTVIAMALHSILRLIENHSKNPEVPYYQTVLATFHELFRPNLLTALTTSVGFFALVLSDAPMIKEFGLSVGIALLVTWLNTAILLPCFLVLIPPPQLRPWMSAKARWPFFIFRFHKSILVSIVVLSALGAWKGQSLAWRAKLFDDLPENYEVRRTTEIIDRSLGGIIPLDVEVRLAPGENPWADEKNMQTLNAVAKLIREKRGVGSVITMADIMKTSGLRSGKQRTSIAEAMLLLSMSNENPLTPFLSSDGLSTRLAIRIKDIPGSRMWHLVQEIRKTVRDYFPQAKVKLAGTAAYVHDINNAVSKDLLYGFWQAMLVIFVLLVLSYRSFAWALLACLPNLTPPSLLLGALATWQIPIKPGIAIILSISLGIAFNNTVYLLERMRQLMAKGISYERSLIHTFWSEANPCFFSSIVLIVGFASFAVSFFKMNQLFGVFMVLSVLSGLLGDLVLLPALMQFLFERGSRFLTVKASYFVWILAFALGGISARTAHADPSAELKKLGQEMQDKLATRDEKGTIEMKIIEANGESKLREISFSRLHVGDTHWTLMRMLAPKDVKGTAVLSIIKNEQEEKWIYLPSSKQTRKITTSGGSSRILDSELSTEDFDLGIIQSAASHILSQAGGETVVESKIANPQSSYSQSTSTVKAGLLQKSQLLDKKGKPLKMISFNNYQELEKGKFRALDIHIENLQSKRKTDLKMKDLKLNSNLKEKDFSTRSLSGDF